MPVGDRTCAGPGAPLRARRMVAASPSRPRGSSASLREGARPHDDGGRRLLPGLVERGVDTGLSSKQRPVSRASGATPVSTNVSWDMPAGTRFAGYRISDVIGRGGMSIVYAAEHVQLGRRIALKLMAPQLASDDSFRERFIRESQIAAA